MSQAAALLTVLQRHHQEAEQDDANQLRPQIMSDAVGGVLSLLELSEFCRCLEPSRSPAGGKDA